MEPVLPEASLAVVYLLCSLYVYFHYVVCVIQEICSHLGIRPFTITPKTE